MSDVVILCGGKPETVSSPGYFYMDAVKVVSPQFSSDITSYPVQRSGLRTDNKVNNNVTISMSGVVTNHFLPTEARYNSPDESKDLIGLDQNRVTKAFSLLRDYWKNNVFITLVLEHVVFENCLLKSVATDFTHSTSDALHVSLEFEQIRIASIEQVVTYDVRSDKTDEATNKNGGGTAGKTDSDDEPPGMVETNKQLRILNASPATTEGT